jgi:hypothetical protein
MKRAAFLCLFLFVTAGCSKHVDRASVNATSVCDEFRSALGSVEPRLERGAQITIEVANLDGSKTPCFGVPELALRVFWSDSLRIIQMGSFGNCSRETLYFLQNLRAGIRCLRDTHPFDLNRSRRSIQNCGLTWFSGPKDAPRMALRVLSVRRRRLFSVSSVLKRSTLSP